MPLLPEASPVGGGGGPLAVVGAHPLRLAGLATSPVGGGSYYAVTPRSLPRMTGEGDRSRWWGHAPFGSLHSPLPP